jgi:hypothetical protein
VVSLTEANDRESVSGDPPGGKTAASEQRESECDLEGTLKPHPVEAGVVAGRVEAFELEFVGLTSSRPAIHDSGRPRDGQVARDAAHADGNGCA